MYFFIDMKNDGLSYFDLSAHYSGAWRLRLSRLGGNQMQLDKACRTSLNLKRILRAHDRFGYLR